MTPYGQIGLDNIGSGNGLLPTGTKPWPEPMLINQFSLIALTVSQEMLKIFIFDSRLKSTN